MTILAWVIMGLGLVLAEFVVPGLILVFFGFAALTVALFMGFGWLAQPGLQFAVFGVSAVLYLLVLRRVFQRWLKGRVGDASEGDGMLEGFDGERVVVIKDFSAGRGEVELNGVHWQANSDEALQAGDIARVIGKDSLILRVEKATHSA